MNFKIYFFVLAAFVFSTLPSISHAWCDNPRIPENVPGCENIEHTRWPGPRNWASDTITYVNYGDTVNAGRTATIITQLYQDITFKLADKSPVKEWAWVDNLELTYHIKTEDGTAKAGKDYQAIDSHVTYEAFPVERAGGAHNRSFNHLIIRHIGPRNNQNRGIYPSTRLVFSANKNEHVVDGHTFTKGTAKYFYVTLYNPWLYMYRRYCSSRAGKICLYYKTNSWSGYLYSDAWKGVVIRNPQINAPKTIKQVVFIVQTH